MSKYAHKTKEKQWDAICLVLDVGASSSKSGFFDQLKKCSSELIQRKLYSSASDRFGIVLCGTRSTKNSLQYANVTVPSIVQSCLIEANFDLLSYLENRLESQKSNVSGDWLDAVVVALDYLKNCIQTSSNVIKKKIVLISDLESPSKENHLKTIANSMEKEGVEFSFIGPDFDIGEPNGKESNLDSYALSKKITPSDEQSISLSMVEFFIKATSGFMINIEHAILAFAQKESVKKNPSPWRVCLEIGSDIRIPVVGFIRVRRENPQTWKRCLSKANSDLDETLDWNIKPEVTFVKNDEDLTVVELSDLIESFKYGSELVPIPRDDKAVIYTTDEKSLKLIGFIDQSEIPTHLALGDGSMVFQPERGNQSSIDSLSALVNALYSKQMAALVRKVYRARSTPRLGILVPSMMSVHQSEEQALVLVFIEMPYMEDIRSFHFAPLYNETSKPSEEQLSSVDDLIDALKVDDTCLQPETIMNPYYQHLYNCLTQRVISPFKGMPEVSEEVKKIMDQPEHLKVASVEPLKKISNLFPLQEIILRPEKRTGEKFFVTKKSDIPIDQKTLQVEDLNLTNAGRVTSVGTTNPVEDFNNLIQDGYSISAVATQIERVILNLMQTGLGSDFSEKILTSLAAYREGCINNLSSRLYNAFIRDLKIEILTAIKFGEKFWNQLSLQDLLLIPKSADPSSDVEELECFKFKEVESMGSQDSGHESPSIQDSVGDLLDDL